MGCQKGQWVRKSLPKSIPRLSESPLRRHIGGFHAISVVWARIGNRTVRRAEKENRKHGVPTVYLIRNHIYYERPDGTLNRQDRFSDDEPPLSGAGTVDCVLNTLTAQFAGFSLGDENIGHQSTVQLSRIACARYTKVLRVCASDL